MDQVKSPCVDLLGDPLPEPLPSNERLTSIHDLAGHEVRAVFEGTSGTYGHAALVIVTATGCWLALDVGGYSFEECQIEVIAQYSSKPIELVGFVRADDLRRKNCISDAEYTRLRRLEQEHKEIERQRKANHLRQQLAEIEGKA